ncbi:MAG: sugar phosphate nucleotidyltransferase [Balneolaceae bacterium]|nr:sugar phosphate nucleotidyltransferase [Balneolaceae bacterium]
MKPTLIILAAGMGSRYGGLKQFDTVGPFGETIMDYTIFDAIKAGFGKVVFVIRKNMEDDFRESILNRINSDIDTEIVFQELTDLPLGLTPPARRNKPWGTAHALWVCRDVVDQPFAMANADDFYGRTSFNIMAQHLSEISKEEIAACMIGYKLEKTLSPYGSVSRGICETDEDGYLISIKERTKIIKETDQIYYEEDNMVHHLSGQEIASMNLLGFTPPVFSIIEKGLASFCKKNKQDLKAEYYVPEVLQELIDMGVKVPVLLTSSEWFGVTYAEDKKYVRKQLLKQHRQGIYPLSLVG